MAPSAASSNAVRPRAGNAPPSSHAVITDSKNRRPMALREGSQNTACKSSKCWVRSRASASMPLSTGMLRSPPERCGPGAITSDSNATFPAVGARSSRCAISGAGHAAPGARPRRSNVRPSRSSSTHNSSGGPDAAFVVRRCSPSAATSRNAASSEGSWLNDTTCWRDRNEIIAARVGRLPGANSRCSPAASACGGSGIVEPPLFVLRLAGPQTGVQPWPV